MRQGFYRITRGACLIFLVACLHRTDAAETAQLATLEQGQSIHFENPPPRIANASSDVNYNLELTNETYEIFVPRNYSDKDSFGIFVFIDSQNEMTIPKEWASIMEKEKLICLIPQKIGNDQMTPRRLGVAYVGILKTMERYNIDSKRIFTAGYSGGARCSLHLALIHSDVIRGNISICGADFYEPVPKVKATDNSNYGVWPVTRDRVIFAKTQVRFVFITGDRDFRHGNILDIYEGGFLKNGFQAKLIDEPNTGHQLCSPESLTTAIHFLNDKQ